MKIIFLSTIFIIPFVFCSFLSKQILLPPNIIIDKLPTQELQIMEDEVDEFSLKKNEKERVRELEKKTIVAYPIILD